METAIVANIQKCCVHDGPGLRTVIFLKGCPLRCAWCQNPENLTASPSLLYNRESCLSCGACLEHCERGAGVLTAQGLVFDRTKCRTCTACADSCLTGAKSVCGKQMTVQEVYNYAMQDEMFYRTSGGGVTLSGGEPTIHAAFCRELFDRLHESGVHTALETCGYCRQEVMQRLAESTDLFLFDFKLYSEKAHIQWTGKSNQIIRQNLEQLTADGRRVIVRIPLVPGVNDGEEFLAMMRYLSGLRGLKQIHIMPFHQVGSSKYGLAGKAYQMTGKAECTAEYAQAHALISEQYGFDTNIGGWDAA
ncbi:MAG: glycyl-radical enzyme activating protein [Eubacterium sp.]|nr:glycyl-radical enzyme activating protein [Eubacterium sp.]